MPTDTLWFFEIFLGGFVTIWTFRYFSNNKEKYSEFEWFALSALWGIIIMGLLTMLPDQAQTKNLLGNPLATGLTASFFGLIVGYMGSRLVRMKWFRWVIDFFGRGEEDKSGKLF